MTDDDNEVTAMQALKDIALLNLKEQRSARRWRIFFKLFFIGFFLMGFLLLLAANQESSDKDTLEAYTAVVEINGPIMIGTTADADSVISSLRAAFEDEKTKGVVVRINSPGGSPVQAGYINDEIYRLREEYPDTPLYVVVADICASGGYYIAAAADKIYADKASLIGSIGVRVDGFGLVNALEQLGVERRLLTAGEHKGMLDPFLPEDSVEVGHMKRMLANIHQQFIQVVKKGRGDRLQDNPDIFSGLIWTGEQAQKLGLIDALGSTAWVAREVIGVEDTVNFTPEKSLFDRLSSSVSASLEHLFFKVSQNQQAVLLY